MNATADVSPVAAEESLARFITLAMWVRADRTIRQDAFIPPKDLNLSVTRHLGLSEHELWRIGRDIVRQLEEARTAGLFGRADVTAGQVSAQKLKTDAAPVPGNPNHAHITGWPLEKPARKMIAQQLAAASIFVPQLGA